MDFDKKKIVIIDGIVHFVDKKPEVSPNQGGGYAPYSMTVKADEINVSFDKAGLKTEAQINAELEASRQAHAMGLMIAKLEDDVKTILSAQRNNYSDAELEEEVYQTVGIILENLGDNEELYQGNPDNYLDYTKTLFDEYTSQDIGLLSYVDIIKNPPVAEQAIAARYENMLENNEIPAEPTLGIESGELKTPFITDIEHAEPKETILQKISRVFGALIPVLRDVKPKIQPNDDIPEIAKIIPEESNDPIVTFIKGKYDVRINATQNRVNLSQSDKNDAIDAMAWKQETVDMDLVSLKEKLGAVYFHMANDTDKYGDKLFELHRMHNEGNGTDCDKAFDKIVTIALADKLTEKLTAGLPFEDPKEIQSLVQGMTNKGFSKEQLQDWAFSDDKSTLDILAEAGNDEKNGYLASIKHENGRIRGGNNRWVRMMAQAKYKVDPDLGIEAFKQNVLNDVTPKERADYLSIVFNQDDLMINKLYQLNKADDFDLTAFKDDPQGYELPAIENNDIIATVEAESLPAQDHDVIHLPDHSTPNTDDIVEPMLPKEEKKKGFFSRKFALVAIPVALIASGVFGHSIYPSQDINMDQATAEAPVFVDVSSDANIENLSGLMPGAGNNDVNVFTDNSNSSGGMGGSTTVNVSYSYDTGSFGEAFAQARESGLQEFSYQDSPFSAVTMDEVKKAGQPDLRSYLNAKKPGAGL